MKAERPNCWILLCGLFAAILGLKVYLIHRFGTDLPFMDQWAREGDMMIAPAREGTLKWSDFFVPHSEHRIVPTLLLNLGLAEWAGQWDARVECVVNAVIHSAIIVLFTGYVFRVYSRSTAIAAGWLQIALGLTALDWENTLIGFQSEFYFILGFSMVALWGMIDPRGWRAPRWWGGLLCGVLAMISLGSGLLCFIPIGFIAAVRLYGGARCPQRASRSAVLAAATTLLTAIGAFALGWLTRGDAPWDIPLHAKSVSDFLLYFAHCAEWPAHGWTAIAALVWLPWAYFAIRHLGRSTIRQEILLGAGLWVLLQIAAVSFYRGVDGGFPSSRYSDIFAFGLVVNLLSWVERDLPARWHRPRQILFAAWILILLTGSTLGAFDMWHNLLPSVAGRSRVYEENVGLYLRTGDVSRLHPPHIVPFPDIEWFKRMIDRPSIRPMMPVSVRAPAFESSVSAAFRHFCGAGIWLFGGGILVLLGLGALTWRRTE